MIFGDKKTFAIVAKLDANPTQYFFGNMSFWANNVCIGQHDERVMMHNGAQRVFAKLRHSGDRHDQDLEKMDAKQFLDFLHRALFEDTGQSITESLRTWDVYGKFCISYGLTESFDGWLIGLIEMQSCCRLIWRETGWRGDTSAHEVRLESGVFESVIASFIKWMSNETGFTPVVEHKLNPILLKYWPELR